MVACVLIVLFYWDKYIALFPSNDPYKQPLQTGKGVVEVMVEPNDIISKGRNRFGEGYIELFDKQANNLLWMGGWAECQQLENGLAVCDVDLELNMKDKSIGTPICDFLAEIKYVVIWFEKLPSNSKVISGKIALTFNNTAPITIEIPSQVMDGNKIGIKDAQKYLKKGN